MASKMANWIAYQERHLSPEDFAAWKAGDVKVQSYLDKQNRVPAVIRNLDDLQRDILKKVIGPGLERASNFLAQVERAGAAGLSKTGLLAQSIGSIKPKLYQATFCGYVASGPRRGFARSLLTVVNKKGSRAKRASKKFTAVMQTLSNKGRIANPVAYAQYLIHGRKAITAGQRGSGKKALRSAAGQFFGHSVQAAPAKNFMRNAEAGADSAANIATEEMNLRLQTLLGEKS